MNNTATDNAPATKKQFIAIYESIIIRDYGNTWAANPEQLSRFMSSVVNTLYTQANTWNIDSPLAREAWKRIGMSGKPTYKGLRGLL